jgi:cytochrome c
MTPVAGRTQLVPRIAVSTIIALALGPLAIGATFAASSEAPRAPRILVFTKTTAFRHASIAVALRAVRELGKRNGIVVDATEDGGAFSPSNLARYQAVVFLLTSGDVLTDSQEAAFERFIRAGGGFAGVHSSADTEYGWDWYGRLLGTRFKSHPQIQGASIRVQRRNHPSSVGLPRRWARVDEWYNFTRNPRGAAEVLATVDETSYSPGDGAMGADHPIAWFREFQGGRAWFTGGGHTDNSYSEPHFRRHLIGGIRYAAGLSPPKIISVAGAVEARRLVVSVRYQGCYPCAGRLEIRVRGRLARIPLRLSRGVGGARSATLARGTWRFSVLLTDPSTGLRDVAGQRVRIS